MLAFARAGRRAAVAGAIEGAGARVLESRIARRGVHVIDA